MALRSKNLNLIPILQALLKEQSVARAADQVGLSQPAMSGALARLREALDDPLLVRVGRSMRLTPRALGMRKQLDEVCAQIELLFQPESFDPSTAELCFRIAAPDYLVFLLTEILLEQLATQAPNIRIEFVDVPGDLPTLMENSVIDLAVCADFALWPELRYADLFRETYVAAVARDHPLAKRSHVTSKDLLEYPSPSLNYDASFTSAVRSTRGANWTTGIPIVDFSSQITTMSLFNAILLASRPPVVARAPASLVRRLGNFLPLAVIEIADEETSFNTGMFWTVVTDEALGHKWLRKKIKECFVTEPLARRQSAPDPS